MIKPVNKYILVNPLSEEKKGNVYLPINNSLPYKKGLVVAVSDKVTQVQVNDIVAYYKRGLAVEGLMAEDKIYDIINEDGLLFINEEQG
jgi:co-chaperonin GroES (HSP10)